MRDMGFFMKIFTGTVESNDRSDRVYQNIQDALWDHGRHLREMEQSQIMMQVRFKIPTVKGDEHFQYVDDAHVENATRSEVVLMDGYITFDQKPTVFFMKGITIRKPAR